MVTRCCCCWWWWWWWWISVTWRCRLLLLSASVGVLLPCLLLSLLLVMTLPATTSQHNTTSHCTHVSYLSSVHTTRPISSELGSGDDPRRMQCPVQWSLGNGSSIYTSLWAVIKGKMLSVICSKYEGFDIKTTYAHSIIFIADIQLDSTKIFLQDHWGRPMTGGDLPFCRSPCLGSDDMRQDDIIVIGMRVYAWYTYDRCSWPIFTEINSWSLVLSHAISSSILEIIPTSL